MFWSFAKPYQTYLALTWVLYACSAACIHCSVDLRLNISPHNNKIYEKLEPRCDEELVIADIFCQSVPWPFLTSKFHCTEVSLPICVRRVNYNAFGRWLQFNIVWLSRHVYIAHLRLLLVREQTSKNDKSNQSFSLLTFDTGSRVIG